MLILVASSKSFISRQNSKKSSSCRGYIRNSGRWGLVWRQYDDSRFKQTFRLSKDTLIFILSRIHEVIVKKDSVEEAITPEIRLVISIYHLGDICTQ